MGYTHYWRRPRTFPAKAFAAWAEDVKRIINALPQRSLSAGAHYRDVPLTLRGEDTDQPVITGDEVLFNGAGCDPISGEDLGHATFYVERVYHPYPWWKPDERGWYLDMCKTSRKPYDLAVTAALIRLTYRFPEGVLVTSDGAAADWQPGLDLCKRLFGSAWLPPEIGSAGQGQSLGQPLGPARSLESA